MTLEEKNKNNKIKIKVNTSLQVEIYADNFQSLSSFFFFDSITKFSNLCLPIFKNRNFSVAFSWFPMSRTDLSMDTARYVQTSVNRKCCSAHFFCSSEIF